MPKRSVTVTIDVDLLEWVNEEIEKKEFASISHALEKALVKLKEQYEKPRLQYDREPHLEYDTRKKEDR